MKKIILPLNHVGLLLVALCVFTVDPGFAAPRIECANPTYDFGTQISGQAITNRFILSNAGDEPLEIVQIKNCCGVETKVAPMTVPPGSNAVCSSVFNTNNRYGVQDKQILLVTNDKMNLYYDLRMTGTLRKPVEFEPRYIQLKNVLPDSVVSETITVTNLHDAAISLKSVSTTVKGLDVVVVRDEASRLHETAGKGADKISTPRRSWTILLKSSEALLPVGQISGKVRLNFSTGTVDVPVVGNVNPIIQATPEQIQLSSDSTSEVTRLIMLRSGDERAFDVISAELKEVEGSVEISRQSRGIWKVSIRVKPASVHAEAAVVIKTSLASRDVILIPLFRSGNRDEV